MQVDQSRSHNATGRIDQFRTIARQCRTHRRDASVTDSHIGDTIGPGLRVYHGPAVHHKVKCRCHHAGQDSLTDPVPAVQVAESIPPS
ncbi:MAG: hypothetical protein EB145_10990 [Proteobacteria bacterium]|nr:hypothetical protein [Pseudomonadota bacterium]